MNETANILLGSAKHKLGTNEDNFIELNLTSSEREIPYTEDSYTLDAYKQYYKEKDESEKYRLAFTITPYCTNVLFNVITEIVYNEGSSDCGVVLWSKDTLDNNSFYPYQTKYVNKGLGLFLRKNFIRDTTYSLPEIDGKLGGTLEYHCGFDIFNNHYFRKKDFVNIGRVNYNDGETNFNTLSDYQRRNDGSIVTFEPLKTKPNTVDELSLDAVNKHVYQKDTVTSYFDAISNNLTDENGWLGFRNKSTFSFSNIGPTPEEDNYYPSGLTVNRCMNNRNIGDFIDMYPDRTLFSFVPKYNKHRQRVEPNWDYCITYPFSSTNDCYLIHNADYDINGIKAKIVTRVEGTNFPLNLFFKTAIRHNLTEGDLITMTFVIPTGDETTVKNTDYPVRVTAVGNENGDNKEHYFSVHTESILNEVTYLDNNNNVAGIISNFNDIRVRKNEDGADCEYYVRFFRKIKTYNSSLNKLAFSQNIYSDQVAQIIFTEDINTSGLVDNRNRPISELFLTIIKRNKGWETWYRSNNAASNFANLNVEYSHCFGKVTSGFDLGRDADFAEYNVHRIHNVDTTKTTGIASSPSSLEDNLTISGVDFVGDIVQYSPYRLEETSIEDVYHRFNTAQRELTDNPQYSGFTYDEIFVDDFELSGDSSTNFIETHNINDELGISYINVLPEGYIYKPHYRVKLRNFSDTVNSGRHIAINYEFKSVNGLRYTIKTDRNYYFQPASGDFEGSLVYIYKMDNGINYTLATTGHCTDVDKNDSFKTVEIELSTAVDIAENCLIFRHNTEMPSDAINIEDGSGRYIWKEIMPFSEVPADDELYDSQFTNGAHYHHNNISFYLKRQDPTGEYGLGGSPAKMKDFLISDEQKDVEYAQYKIDNSVVKC